MGSWELWHIWTIAGLALLAVEIFTAGFVIGLFGVACLAGAVAAGVGSSISMQLLTFGVTTALLAFSLRPLLAHYGVTNEIVARTNVDALVGQLATVTQSAGIQGKRGRVQVGGEDWLAEAAEGFSLREGATVVVRTVEGCKLIVDRKEGPSHD